MAQKITGTVTNDGNVLTGVSISASPSNRGTISDKEGTYSLGLSPGSYKITYSGAGFIPVIKNLVLAAGEEKTI
ncbi:MAG: carboxypeptidase-like regulatory domain-containing protein, partial [Ferruginibacter sp.]